MIFNLHACVCLWKSLSVIYCVFFRFSGFMNYFGNLIVMGAQQLMLLCDIQLLHLHKALTTWRSEQNRPSVACNNSLIFVSLHYWHACSGAEDLDLLDNTRIHCAPATGFKPHATFITMALPVQVQHKNLEHSLEIQSAVDLFSSVLQQEFGFRSCTTDSTTLFRCASSCSACQAAWFPDASKDYLNSVMRKPIYPC